MINLTKGPIGKNIFFFSIPMLIGNVFQQLYNVADSLIVGNFLGKQALAAVGASFPINFVFLSMSLGISIGISVILSHFYGAKDYQNLKKAVDVMILFNLIMGLLLTLLGFIFVKQIFTLLNLPPELMKASVDYFRIFMLGTVFALLYNGYSSVLRALGDSKTPLYFLILSTLLNVILDFSFVYFFGWGIKGVAYATVISQIFTLICLLFYLKKFRELKIFGFRNMSFDIPILKKSLKIGLPTGFQQTFVSLGMMALMRFINGFGTDTVAAYSIASRLDSFASMPAMNFASALSTFVGQNIGAGQLDRVTKGYRATLLMSGILAVTVTLIFFLFGKILLSFFTRDANVISIGYGYLTIVGSCYILFSCMFITHGLLRGVGITLIPMFITLFSLWLFRIPMAYFLSKPSFNLGAKGIWLAIPIAWFLGFVASLIYYSKSNWRAKKLIHT
jgi:putative MATE family efflux protein